LLFNVKVKLWVLFSKKFDPPYVPIIINFCETCPSHKRRNAEKINTRCEDLGG
jgi:hypothetical protein